MQEDLISRKTVIKGITDKANEVVKDIRESAPGSSWRRPICLGWLRH